MEEIRKVRSPGYNYNFSTKTGYFERWGKTKQDDPDYSPNGPEIIDCEISTICNQGCKFCYKGNTSKGENMSLETFKKLFSKFPKDFLPTQIAFGIGSIDSNPDTFPIMQYCRDNGVIPNITINGSGMTPELYDKLVAVCGAVAISLIYDGSEKKIKLRKIKK